MGYRLKLFLTDALPNHPEYKSMAPRVFVLRKKSEKRLEWICKRLELIALRIDEESLNTFILRDLNTCIVRDLESQIMVSTSKDTVPTITDTSDSSDPSDVTSEEKEASPPDSEWERFSGWSLDIPMEATLWKQASEVSFDSDDRLISDSSLSDSWNSSNSYMWAWDNPKVEDAEDAEIDTSFLMEIATQEVKYESDSEAVDSWAQGEGSSKPDATDDAARVALKEILNNAASKCKTGSQDNPVTTSSSNSTPKESGEMGKSKPEDTMDSAWMMNHVEKGNAGAFLEAEDPSAILEQEWVSFDKNSQADNKENRW